MPPNKDAPTYTAEAYYLKSAFEIGVSSGKKAPGTATETLNLIKSIAAEAEYRGTISDKRKMIDAWMEGYMSSIPEHRRKEASNA